MKNRFLIIVWCMAVWSLASCVHYTEDLFDKSASERIAASTQTYRELLVAQTNGWLVEYYPEKTQKYGGFNLYFRFENLTAFVSSERDADKLSSGGWSMGADMGVTLNFDTYNTELHFFADPDPSINGGAGGGRGLSYEGDYEFYVESGSASEFILKGKKTKNTIRMTPFPANTTWKEYVSKVFDMKDEMSFSPAFAANIGGNNVVLANNGTSFTATYTDDEGKRKSENIAYVVTPTGYRLYKPLETSGKQFIDFESTGNNSLTSEGVVFGIYVPDDYLFIESYEGDWEFEYATGIPSETNPTPTRYKREVKLIRDGKTFQLKGLWTAAAFTNRTLVLKYAPASGRLTLAVQAIDTYNTSQYISFAAWQVAGNGSLWPTFNASTPPAQQGVWDKANRDKPVITWTDYGNKSYYTELIRGWILWRLTSAGVSAGQHTGEPTVDSRFVDIIMTKK